MNELVTILLTGAVGGAIVSSIIGPFFNRYQERRKIRAEVLKALLEVERSRWASDSVNYDAYIKDVQKLRASALIARAYRPLVEFYVQASALARSGSEDDFESDKTEFGGSIDSEIADFVSETAEVLIDYLWHPYISRFSIKHRLAQLKQQRAQLKRKYTGKKPQSDRLYDWERKI